MPLGLIGQKVGMIQVYNEKGDAVPCTVLKLGPCPVLQIRTKEKDGYSAVQLGYMDKPRRVSTRGERGHVSEALESKRRKQRREAGVALLPKANVEPQRYIREFRLDGETVSLTVGDKLVPGEVFKDIKAVDVIGT